MALYDEIFLLITACVVAIISRRMRVPYTVGLVLVGTALALYGIAPTLHLSHDLVFQILLPPLIFEAAIHLKWKELKPVVGVIALLATAGVFLAAIVSTAALTLLSGLPWQTCLVIGVVLAATDPVSVLALLKESALPPKVYKLIEAESLFNDGTASVLFTLIPILLLGQTSPVGIASLSLLSIGGGILVGVAVGFGLLFLAGRTADHLVEIAITVVAAFGSFLLAEHFHASGVLSTLTAGMVMANFDYKGSLPERGREDAATFWEFAGFLVNSLIFLLIGIDISLWSSSGSLSVWLVASTIGASLLGRAVSVYGGCLAFRRTASAVPLRVQNLLFWGGLRGALSIALVLGLPPGTENRELIISTVFQTVAFSIVIQGLTVGPLIKRVASE